MNRLPLILAAVLFVHGFGFAQPAAAAPIVYSFSGAGSGAIGGTSFTDAAFTALVQADTADVAFQPTLGAFGALRLTATIDIAGIGLANFTPLDAPICQPNCGIFVFGGNGIPVLGFGTFFDNGNLIRIDDAIFSAYDLVSDFGPVVGPNSSLNQFINASTDLGSLSFNSMSEVSFIATVVPEPATSTLFAFALFSLAAIGLLRPRRDDRIRAG